MKIDLLVVGTGGLAKETAQLARIIDPRRSRWRKIGYVTSSVDELGKAMPYGDVEITDEECFSWQYPIDVVLGIGSPFLRRKLSNNLLKNENLSFPNLYHPLVEFDDFYNTVGRGNVFCKGAVLTCGVTIGDFNVFNWNSTIGHDASVGSFNVLNPAVNVSGYTTIGDACLLGVGSQILEHLSVVSDCVVGAGAVVTSSIVRSGTYVGVPARILG